MRFMKLQKIAAIAMTMSVLAAGTALAGWQYYENGPIACWTNSETGQQVFVYAGQPAPDGTPAPTVQVSGMAQGTDPIAAANAAADAAKAARGGNVSVDSASMAAELQKASQAANANRNTNDVTVITKEYNKSTKGNSYTNANLPTIKTSAQNQNNQSGLNMGAYTSPDGTKTSYQGVTTINNGATSGENGVYGYYAGSGYYVTNSGSPNVGTQVNQSSAANTNSSGAVSNVASNTTANATSNATAQNYSGTLPKTNSNNVVTQRVPQM